MNYPIHIELVEAAREGDSAAIESLLQHCQPSITRFARKYCATPEDVEDAVQLTLWLIHRKITALRTTKAFISWIFSIVKNQCYRLLGSNREQSIELSQLEHLCSSNDNEGLALLQHDIVKAISQVPSSYRQILIMRDIEGLTAAEVSEELDLSLQTVKSRLHYGRNILREKLQHWID
jgi:RNA polymerase sigma factor (sigma-70 family)